MSTPPPPIMTAEQAKRSAFLAILKKILKYPLLYVMDMLRPRIEAWRQGPVAR